MAIIEFENGVKVEFDGTPTQQDVEEVAKRVGIFKEKTKAIEEPSVIGGITESLSQRKEKVREITEAEARGEQGRGESIFQTLGQVAGGVSDIASELVGGVARTAGGVIGAITPTPLKEAYTGAGAMFLQSSVGKKAIEATSQGFEAYEQWKAKNPRAARNFESVVDIATLIPLGAGTKAATKTTIKAARPLIEPIAVATLRQGAKRAVVGLDETIIRNFNKAVKPSIVGKGTAELAKKYSDNVTEAVKTIVENKDNLKYVDEFGGVYSGTPRSLQEFSEAISKTKSSIFERYHELSVKSGKAGAQVDLQPIANELETIANSKVLQTHAQNIADYAQQKAIAIRRAGVHTPEEAEEAIRIYNKSLEAFYKNPSYETASRATIDSMIVNNLRRDLDNVIESTTEAGYAGLKKQYGALKAIEKDVNKQAIIDARRNIKGLIDFSDVFSGGQVINGILNMNPGQIASGAVQKAIAETYKYINNPNRIVKSMFSGVESAYRKAEKFNISVR